MRFIDVQVDEHDELPDGCSLRFRAQSEGWPIERVSWESEEGTAGIWLVEGRDGEGAPVPAIAYPVDDSSAGTSILIVGGRRGLRLTFEGDGAPSSSPAALAPDGAHSARLTSVSTAESVSEPYLLVSRSSCQIVTSEP